MGSQRPYYLVNSNDIYGIDDFDQGEDFWNHHGHTKDEYMSLAEGLPEVNERVANGESLESLREDPNVGACASAYYGSDMVKVDATDEGYEFDSDGRHRVKAAQELGYDVPVQVKNSEQMDREPDQCNLYKEDETQSQHNQDNASDLTADNLQQNSSNENNRQNSNYDDMKESNVENNQQNNDASELASPQEYSGESLSESDSENQGYQY